MGQDDSLVTAGMWLQQLLLGSAATAVATLAMAGVGVAMLTGRIDIRRGVMVVVGCFMLFAAPLVAAGLRTALANTAPPAVAEISPAPPVVALPAQTRPPAIYDPYAGAAVPQTR